MGHRLCLFALLVRRRIIALVIKTMLHHSHCRTSTASWCIMWRLTYVIRANYTTSKRLAPVVAITPHPRHSHYVLCRKSIVRPFQTQYTWTSSTGRKTVWLMATTAAAAAAVAAVMDEVGQMRCWRWSSRDDCELFRRQRDGPDIQMNVLVIMLPVRRSTFMYTAGRSTLRVQIHAAVIWE